MTKSPASMQQFASLSHDPAVRGFLHQPAAGNEQGIVLTHGAGGNANSTLLVELAEAFAGADFTVLRCNLPFRQDRPSGPPRPGDAARDRDGLKNAVGAIRELVRGRVFLGGQSYGGRQATMLCADQPGLADGLLLLSYPLHAPGRPDQPRIQHLPKLQVPCLFVHGTRDPFGSIAELESALKLIPGNSMLVPVEGVGHDLGFKAKSKRGELPAMILGSFQKFFG